MTSSSQRTRVRRLAAMPLAVIAAALVLGCLPTEGVAGVTDRFAPCEDVAHFPELGDSTCTAASVPLWHEAAADGASIDLFVRRFPAAEPANRRGEIWLVAGGPGEPGASLHPVLPTFRAAFPHHDLVLPDHRGTGGSERLCPEQESVESAAGVALAGEEWGPCIGGLHSDPDRVAAFSITQAAHDLSTLLERHRSDGEVLLYGVSYGTQLALRMLQVAPAALDGLILDGLVPPENAPQWDLSRRTAVVDEVGRAFLGEAAQAHAGILSGAGKLTFSTVQDGAHFLAYAAPACFIEVASAFVADAHVPEDCTEPHASSER